MNGAELAGVILGGIGAITGIAGLGIAYRSAKASEVSAAAAKATVDFQVESYRKEKMADLRFVPMNIFGHTASTRMEDDILWIDMLVSNIGPHWANDVRLYGAIYEHAVASENPPLAVAPNTKEPISLPVNLTLLPRSIRTKFPLRVEYLDGNGRQQVEFPVLIEGSQDEKIIHARFITPDFPE